MRGVHRSKKTFSPLKFLFFIIIFCVLSNLFPSSMFDTTKLGNIKLDYKNLQWSDLTRYTKRYSQPVRVNYFEQARLFAKSYMGFDMFYVLFNLFRLVLASVLKDYVIDFLPFTKSKSVGQKLITSMRSQLNDTTESDSEMEHVRQSQIETEKRKRDLGIAGYYSSKAVFKVSSTAYSFVFQLLKNAKMLISFIYYVLRMVGLGFWLLLQIPKQLIQGFYTGLLDTGVMQQNSRMSKIVENLPNDLGIRQIFIDSIVELFHASDDDDELHVTGMPFNRNVSRLSDSSDSSCHEGDCNVCDGVTKTNSKASIASSKRLQELQSWKESLTN